jgi:acyl-CoA hydrolase/RimJ/RimL family protein N-acetyltransferase
MPDPDRALGDWRRRAVSAAEAIAAVRSGDHVFLGTACATPRALISALENREDPVSGVRYVHFLTDGSVPVYEHGPFSRYRHRTFFVGSDLRPLVGSGKVDYIPVAVSQVHRLLLTGRVPVDVAMIQVAPPDADGRCSLGVSADLGQVAVERARTVIAEVNPRMPRTRGSSGIPLDLIDHVVEVDSPVIEYLHEPADGVGEQIARYVARIIDDGSTLQVGLGRIPNEMLKYLTNRRDLGIHSDVITEPVVDLLERGVVTGARKTLHPGKVVTSYCMGSRRLYDLVDDNPAFLFLPISETCDPDNIARNERMVSVSQAFAVDLTGQVCADQFGGEFYSGVSSQPDFLRGAAAANGGKAIICLASTTDDGAESRIRASLREGEGVTVARSDVHYVVTEYGIAYLFGKSISERALALIEIADPRFRAELLEAARELGYLGTGHGLRSRGAYPSHEERTVQLKDGREVLLRPSRAGDVDSMQELFYSLTEEDVLTRFFTNLTSLSISKAQHLCSVSYEEEMAFVAVVGDPDHGRVVGSGCYYVDPSTNLADVAYMIHPEWQGSGLGTALQDRLVEYARGRGLRGFTADVLCDNEAMLRVLENSGCRIEKRIASGVYEVVMLFGFPRRTEG